MKRAPSSIGPWLLACVAVIAFTVLVLTGHKETALQVVGVSAAVLIVLGLIAVLDS